MPLSPEHLPLPRSLKDKVAEEFSPQNAPQSADSLSRETLVGFLAKSKDTDSSPLATIKRRAAKENRRPDLRPEDQAALAWVCDAFDEWEEHFPLEQPLKDHIHRLLPLAVAMALKDDTFYTPGSHPLHRLLDALQNGAVGWQMRLDRAGQMLEQRIQRAVEKALDWFNNDRLDIGAITQELLAANERDVARAQRMVQRLAETEEARLKTLAARRDAARDINAGLEQFELPAAIGEFLKGPWYDSAQLVLVKDGANSRQWEQMRRATLHLMESVQAPEDSGDVGRDRQEQILRHLPGELRRWLLSLEHDSDATDSAIGLVEYAHLRIQHGQKLQLVNIAAIPLDEETSEPPSKNDNSLNNGDWYRFEDDAGELRAQLVLQLEEGQHLLFANFVGLKALDLSRRAFSQRVSDRFSVVLPNRETFSLCLATAAGIDSEDRLRQWLDPSYPSPAETATLSDEQAGDEERHVHSEGLRTQEQDLRAENEDTATQQDTKAINLTESPGVVQPASLPKEPEAKLESSNVVESSEAATWSEVLPDLSDTDEFDPILTPPEGAEIELTLELDDPLEPLDSSATSTDQLAPASPAVPPPTANTNDAMPPPEQVPQSYPAPSAATPTETLPQAAPEYLAPVQAPPPRPEVEASTPPSPAQSHAAATAAASNTPADYAPAASATPPVEDITPTPQSPEPYAPAPAPVADAPPPPPPPYQPAAPEAPAAAPPQSSSAAVSAPPTPPPPPPQEPAAVAAPPPAAPAAPTPPTAPPPAPPVASTPEPSPPANVEREVEVPMGAWLGFHDGETPIMAKLAVFDPRRDNYIFVNRKGIAMRELSRSELRALMDQGLVDILETRSYFRDEVERAREEGQ